MTEQYEMLRRVSRTFALSIEQLPSVVRDALTVAYLLLRVSDTLEDDASMPADRKVELLGLWERVMRGGAPAGALAGAAPALDASDAELQLVRDAPSVLDQLHALPPEVQRIILEHVTQTTRGMARWQLQGPTVATEEEMDDYMHQVAGLVGYLITEVYAWYSPLIRRRRELLLPLGREFGLALQTVNVVRGLHQDFLRGWSFVPLTFCRAAQLDPADFFRPEHRDRAMAVVQMVIDKAERHLEHGLAYVRALPRRHHRLRLMCIWPLLFAARTLALSRDNPDVLVGEAKISREEVRAIMRDAACFGWSNEWLTWYYRRMLRPLASAV